MRILVVGNGGREHALAWKLASDSNRPEVFIAPGNAGTAGVGRNVPLDAGDLDGLRAWCRREKPDLVVVGPEAPLCAGLVDLLAADGILAFGPGREGAQLEGSKTFCKDVLQAAGIPTARAASFTDAAAARRYIENEGAPLVVKADGLAAGKGVSICATTGEAIRAVEDSLIRGQFGAAGAKVIIEECLVGEEVSIHALADGERAVLLASSQDHKRAFDGDQGPNTGGMGAYSPAPVVTREMEPMILEQIILPTLAELRRRGIFYRGVLYAGLMMTASGPRVLEYNSRFGDPETQVILPRWKGDLGPALLACARGRLDPSLVRWSDHPCVCIVLVADGYPGPIRKGDPITGLETAAAVPGVTVFQAGTALDAQGQVVSSGGRVLGVTAHDPDLRQAVGRAYEAIGSIRLEGGRYRGDIAARALNRLPSVSSKGNAT
ncbi:MAG: phosphoribosylamine--glycine ligase [Kiritimatiellia bacterium]|nr:phosphoribosylamine--glycine ligase [Kiritimatiellia bacterium]